MPQVCKTCQHPERLRIEGLVLEGVPVERVARENGLNPMSLSRHLKRHTRKDIAKAKEAKALQRGDSLLDRIKGLADDAAAILRQAQGAGSLDAANGAIGQSLRACELIGRITGEVPTGGGTTIVNQLGVRIDVAQRAVETVREASSADPRDVVERARRVLCAWNAAHPEERVTVT